MPLVRVPVANTVGKTVRIDTAASPGATIGKDLRLPDGTVPSLTELAAALAIEATAPKRSDAYIYWNQILGSYDFIQFDTTFSGASVEGKLQWNTDDGTLEFGLPGGQVTMQIGQEHVIRARNTTGVQIDNGSVVYITGAQGNKPLIALADADTVETARVIAVATENIGHNSFGYITTAGIVRDVDTDGMAVGSDLWLSSTAGGFQVAEPSAPAAAVFIGHVIAEHANNGMILVAITPDSRVRLDDFDLDLQAVMEIVIGTSLDQPDVSASSDGGTITFTLEQIGGGDIRFTFSDGIHTHDCTDPIASIALTAGTDTSPTLNYLYILQSTKALTVSTAGWPSAEHAPLATVLCQSAASAQTDGVYKMHAWTDHNWNEEVGHLAHLNFWIRSQAATWKSGTLLTPSVGAATFDLAVAIGSILQLHPHSYPAFDTSTGSEVMIVNQNGTPYDRVGNMVSQITDASGGSMSGSYYNLVVWGVVSEDDADCQLMVNLPTGSYNSSGKATLDADATTVYDIPTDFIGTGFLIARLVCRHQVSGNTYSIVSNVDLRGKVPSTSAGGTVGGGVTSLGDLSDVDPTGFSDNDLMYWAGGVLIDTAGALTFDGTDLVCGGDLSGVTIGGITEANLVDKSAAEDIAGVWNFTGNELKLQGASARFRFTETDASADNGIWDFLASGENFTLRVLNDALGAANVFVVSRTGLSVDAVAFAAPITATSYGGITEANLLDKTVAEIVAAEWTFATAAGGQLIVLKDTGGTGTAAVAWLAYQDELGSRMGFIGYGSSGDGTLSINNDIHSGHIVLQAENVSGANIELLDLDPDNGVKTQGNYLLEGYATGRSVVRSLHFQINPGATPGTNINVLEIGGSGDRGGYNIPTISNATNLAKSGSSGSFTLNSTGTLITMDITQAVVGILSVSIVLHDINSSSTTLMYLPWFTQPGGNLGIALIRRGGTSVQDWTALMDAGDRVDIKVCFITSS